MSEINWAIGIGSAVGTIPFSEFYSRYGAKWPFLIAMVVSSIATFLFPFVAEISYIGMLVLRFVQVNFYYNNLIKLTWDD